MYVAHRSDIWEPVQHLMGCRVAVSLHVIGKCEREHVLFAY